MNEKNLPHFLYPNTHVAVPNLALTWLNWINTLMVRNQMPLSGDVTQWIETWGQSVAQIGLFNVNTANSGNPETEKEIAGKYSYGRQLGRILDVLAPIVAENGERLCEQGLLAKQELEDFRQMVKYVRSMKEKAQPSILSVLDSMEILQKKFPGECGPKFRAITDALKELKSYE